MTHCTGGSLAGLSARGQERPPQLLDAGLDAHPDWPARYGTDSLAAPPWAAGAGVGRGFLARHDNLKVLGLNLTVGGFPGSKDPGWRERGTGRGHDAAVVKQPFPFSGALARQQGAAPVDVVLAPSPAFCGAPGDLPQHPVAEVAQGEGVAGPLPHHEALGRRVVAHRTVDARTLHGGHGRDCIERGTGHGHRARALHFCPKPWRRSLPFPAAVAPAPGFRPALQRPAWLPKRTMTAFSVDLA